MGIYRHRGDLFSPGAGRGGQAVGTSSSTAKCWTEGRDPTGMMMEIEDDGED